MARSDLRQPDDSPARPPDAWEGERMATLRLALVEGVGPRTRRTLLDRFTTSAAVLAAGVEQLRSVPGIGGKLARRIASAAHEVNAEEELAICRRHGIAVLLETDESYPPRLREIHDPPGVLFVAGQLVPNDALAVAIVGTRHATQYGLQQAERLGSGLARAGYTVVSGLARGVDGAAHRGALLAGGRTIAVLGCGILNLYPPEHRDLAAEISRRGALVSESPPRRQPMSGLFPQRNRVITGMSLGVVVVEAGQRSGALISARHAMEQGRDVFAVPGRVDSRMSHGCHQLLRDGARLVESVDDVLEELGPLASSTQAADGGVIQHPAELLLGDQEKAVLAVIETTPMTIDAVAARCRLPMHRVLATLSVLEMRRLIRRVSGCLIARV